MADVMRSADGTEIIGIADLRAQFALLGRDMETRVSRLMVVAGGRLVRDEAKRIVRANGSVQTGTMLRNIVVKRETKAPKGVAQYHVGVRHGRNLSRKDRANTVLAVRRGRIVQRYVDDPFYFKWVEQGHKVVPPRRRGTKPQTWRARRAAAAAGGKRVRAYPFLAPALVRKREAAIKAMQERLLAELRKAQKTA